MMAHGNGEQIKRNYRADSTSAQSNRVFELEHALKCALAAESRALDEVMCLRLALKQIADHACTALRQQTNVTPYVYPEAGDECQGI